MQINIMHFDITVFNFLNSFANHSAILDYVGIFFANYSQYVLGAILLYLLFYQQEKRNINRPMVTVSLIAAILARLVVKTAILLIHGRPRPYVVLETAHKLIPTSIAENFQSFPSGHTIFFFALATVLYQFNKKLGAWFYVAALAMGIARIFVGVHWPTDIIGGIIMGTLVGLFTMFGYRTYKNSFDKIIEKLFHKIDQLIRTQ